jgi:hypothetical protein
VKLAAVVVLNRTAVAPVNPAPLTTTETPAQPFVGLKPLTAGTAAPAADGENDQQRPEHDCRNPSPTRNRQPLTPHLGAKQPTFPH